MITDAQNNDQLQRLLALKRHELPPPGFFDSLPQQVRARMERQGLPASTLPVWWRHLALEWDLKPALAGLALIAVGGLYFLGIDTGPQSALVPSIPPPTGVFTEFFPDVAASSVLGRQTWVGQPDPSPSLRPHAGTPPPQGLFTPGIGLSVDLASTADSVLSGSHTPTNRPGWVPAAWTESP